MSLANIIQKSPFQYYPQNKVPPDPPQSCIHDRISQTAKAQPEADAVTGHDGQFTYGELESEALSLAHKLVSEAVKPGDIIPICFEHSIWVIVAMLAVLKAGCAFCPVPSSPLSRAKAMLAQLHNPPVVLSSKENSIAMRSFHSHVWSVPYRQDIPASGGFAPLQSSIYDLAYVMFTSGSTGQPKGVMMEQAQLSSFIQNYCRTFGVNRHTRSFQFSAYTFDACIMEIFAPLSAGGCVCIPSEDERFGHLPKAMKTLEVTHAFLVPSVLKSISPKELSGLDCLLIGGETSTPTFWQQWLKAATNVYNVYGPTECCVLSSALLIEGAARSGECASFGDIGYASLLGLRMWIVDPESSDILLPPGTKGEILIEGPSVARGYLNNLAATDQIFIPQPSWLKGYRASPGHLYRSGDIGQSMPDGSIMFVGRNDTQVKIDRQRIELGEIEEHLRTLLPDQPDAVVILAQVDNVSPKRLVAFLVTTASYSLGNTDDSVLGPFILSAEETAATRSSLQQEMPLHMVPSLFITLDAIPRLSSLKIDRKALREIAVMCLGQSSRLANGNLGSTDICSTKEALLHRLWAKVLTLEPSAFGYGDSFLQLGGSSASAMELIALARKSGLTLGIRMIVENPTISGLATKAMFAHTDSQHDPAPFSLLPDADKQVILQEVAATCRISICDIADAYPVTDRLEVFMIGNEVSKSGSFLKSSEIFNIPLHTSKEQLMAACEELVRIFDIFRTRVVKTIHGLIEVVLKASENIDIAPDLDTLFAWEKTRSMDLGEPLNSFALISNGEQLRFVWTCKLLADAWSLRFLTLTLERLLAGETIEQSAKITSLIKWRRDADFSDSVNFFRNHFAGTSIEKVFKIPKDHVPCCKSHRRRESLISLTRMNEFTMPTYVSVALAIVLHQHSQQSDISLCTIRSGRLMPIPRIAEYVGAVVESIPVRVILPPESTIHQLLRDFQNDWGQSTVHEFLGAKRLVQINEQCRAAFENSVTLNILVDDQIGLPEGFSCYEVEHYDLPLAVAFECQLRSWGFSMKLLHDEIIIPSELASQLLERVENIIRRLVEDSRDITLRDVLLVELDNGG